MGMENELKTCSTCRHWHGDPDAAAIAGECHFGPPVLPGSHSWGWPATLPSGHCSRHAVVKTMAFLKASRAPDVYFQQNCEAPLPRALLVQMLGQECRLTRNAAMSRIQTLIRHGKLREGRNDDGVTLEWVRDAVDVTSPRTRYPLDSLLGLLRSTASPDKPIGLRALHRLVAASTPVSLTTVSNLVASGVANGSIS